MIVLELSYLTYRRKKVNDNSKITVANGVKKSEWLWYYKNSRFGFL